MAKSSSSDSNSLGDAAACSMNYLITMSSPRRKPASKTKRPYPIYGRRPITRTPSESCKEILKKKPLNTDLLSSTLMPASISIPDHLDDDSDEDSSGSSSSSCSITRSSSSSCSSTSSSSVGPNHHTLASKDQATAVYVLCKVVNGKFVRV